MFRLFWLENYYKNSWIAHIVPGLAEFLIYVSISLQFLQVSGQDKQSEMRSSRSLGDLKASVLKGSERVRKHSTGASCWLTHTPNTHSAGKMTVHNGFIVSFVCTVLYQDCGMALKSAVTSGLLEKAWANNLGCFEWQRNRLKPSVW